MFIGMIGLPEVPSDQRLMYDNEKRRFPVMLCLSI